MDRKGSRNNRVRADRQKKRKFQGNRTTVETDSIFDSKSAKKLRIVQDDEEVPRDRDSSYVICNFFTIFTAVNAYLECKECHEEVRFDKKNLPGLSFKIQLECSCGVRFVDSSPKVGRASEINRRFVFVSRLIPISRAGVNLFCGLMDIGKGFTQKLYNTCLEDIHIASKSVFESSMKKAIDEEKRENIAHGRPDSELTVSVNGTWKIRESSSKHAVTTLIGAYSKKFIDVVVESSFCPGCKTWENRKNTPEYDEWLETHREKCEACNHSVAESVVRMFERSVENHGVRYGTYIGDLTTYTAVRNAKPYGDEFLVENKESVEDLQASEELPERRCLGSYTQNCNDQSFNAKLWSLAPKHLRCGISSLEIATYITCCYFNEGFTSALKIMCAMGMRIGDEAHDFASKRDKESLERAKRRSASSSGGQLGTRNSSARYDFHLEEEETRYGDGIAD